jgi:hypothetical protein
MRHLQAPEAFSRRGDPAAASRFTGGSVEDECYGFATPAARSVCLDPAAKKGRI